MRAVRGVVAVRTARRGDGGSQGRTRRAARAATTTTDRVEPPAGVHAVACPSVPRGAYGVELYLSFTQFRESASNAFLSKNKEETRRAVVVIASFDL